jgi:hypothetical protein
MAAINPAHLVDAHKALFPNGFAGGLRGEMARAAEDSVRQWDRCTADVAHARSRQFRNL